MSPASLPVWVNNYGKNSLWHKWRESDGEETLSELFWNLSFDYKGAKGLRGLVWKARERRSVTISVHQNDYKMSLCHTLRKVHVSTMVSFYRMYIIIVESLLHAAKCENDNWICLDFPVLTCTIFIFWELLCSCTSCKVWLKLMLPNTKRFKGSTTICGSVWKI